MNVIPYVSLGTVAFGSSEAAVIEILGLPQSTNTSRLGRPQLFYPNYRVALVEGAVSEITANCPVITLAAATIPFQYLAQYLRQHDSGTFDAVGFTVSPAYGISLDPQFPHWVSAFTSADLDTWRKHTA
jgi:hypothetical protein